MEKPIDLHCHSTASDGSLSPEELVLYAKTKGASALALTDHDTVAGISEFLEAGQKYGLETIPGVEISADYHQGTMHVLGYYIDHNHPFLLRELSRLQQARKERNPKIIEKLREMGLPITLKQVQALARGQIGRPHIAQALLLNGIVSSVEEAFQKYLSRGCPAYVEKFRFSSSDSIDLIKKAGGLPVLAHPFTLNIQDPNELKKLLEELKDNGLKGLEIIYPEHTPEQTKEYEKLCQELGLIPTGGSDFHGQINPKIEILFGRGNMIVPYSYLDRLKTSSNI